MGNDSHAAKLLDLVLEDRIQARDEELVLQRNCGANKERTIRGRGEMLRLKKKKTHLEVPSVEPAFQRLRLLTLAIRPSKAGRGGGGYWAREREQSNVLLRHSSVHCGWGAWEDEEGPTPVT